MTARPRRAALAAAALALGCARALHAPAPLPEAPARSTEADLLRSAEAAWARRADPAEARRAQELYTEAASADPSRVAGLLGAMRAASFRIEREKDGSVRAKLAAEAVDLGQHCRRREPKEAACAYRLAIALGEQARERTSTAKDALSKMVPLLHEAIAADPKLDRAGPHRVLALLLLKAPGWPVGPGDKEEALKEAQAAAGLFPDAAENQLALGDVLAGNGRDADARTAWERAEALAEKDAERGDPDAARWREEARAALAKGGRA